jgi:hypothetical protein
LGRLARKRAAGSGYELNGTIDDRRQTTASRDGPLAVVHRPSSVVYGHVRALADGIGPRGSTTPGEARAADYARSVLESAGLKAAVEPFISARSGWWPVALAAALSLVAEGVFWFGDTSGAWIAFGLQAVAFLSGLLELNFVGNPLRWLLPRAPSQNVVAVIPPSGPPTRQVALVGHLDSHRTPFIFGSTARLRAFRLLTILGLLSFVANLILYLVVALSGNRALAPFTLIPAAVMLLVLLMTLQADFTPYTPGANDNATGAALVLTLAERLAHAPLSRTQVWAVCSGCEEVGCYGASAFIARHRDDLRGAYFLVIDSVGGGDLCYVTREAMTLPHDSDPALVALAADIARRRPELGARPRVFTTAYTEGAIGVKAGLHTLTLLGLTPDGFVPNWHRLSDTADRVDRAALDRAEAFVWELLLAIDDSPNI